MKGTPTWNKRAETWGRFQWFKTASALGGFSLSYAELHGDDAFLASRMCRLEPGHASEFDGVSTRETDQIRASTWRIGFPVAVLQRCVNDTQPPPG